MQGALLEQLSSAPTLSAALRADPLDSPVFRAALDAAVDKWWGYLGAQVARKVTWDQAGRCLHIDLVGPTELPEPLLRMDPNFVATVDVMVTLEKEGRMTEEIPRKRSVIGRASTIRNAALCVAWLRDHMPLHFPQPCAPVEREWIMYEWNYTGKHSHLNIVVDCDLDNVTGTVDLAYTSRWVELCRAFLAGAGDLW